MLSERRVKIVATIGPATQTPQALEKAMLSGMNVARLNFSHGTHEVHAGVIATLRELAKKWDAPVCILQDLQGPKIRVGKFKNGAIELKDGDMVTITTRDIMGESKMIPTDFKELTSTIGAGQKILLDDGLI